MFNNNARVINRVLIYRLGSLGDTVVALPSLHLTARAFPKAERRMLTGFPIEDKAPPASAILDGTGLVHGYFRYNIGIRKPIEVVKLWWKLVCWRPQVLVYLCAARGLKAAKRDATFFRLCLIPHHIGVPITENMQQPPACGTRPLKMTHQFGPEQEYECLRLGRNLAALGPVSLDDPQEWDLRLSSAERNSAKHLLEAVAPFPFIAVSVGTKMQAKDWGVQNWRILVEQLSQEYPNHALVLCGAREEFESSAYVQAGYDHASAIPSLNLCGLLTPRESAAVLEQAVLFIGHDSGPMHLAAAVQTPCVAIFSSRNLPRVWFPYGDQHRVLYHHVGCGNCRLETCVVEEKKCIMSITVEEVLGKTNEVMGMLHGGQVRN